MQTSQISNRGLPGWCERAVVGCIFLIAVFAPHSIAATQTFWLLGLFFWVLRLALRPRPKLFRTPVDYWLLGFFVLSGVSGVFSASYRHYGGDGQAFRQSQGRPKNRRPAL